MPPDQICKSCRGRLDSVLWSAGRHPGCGGSPPIGDEAEAHLIGHLARHLGAEVVTEKATQ